MEKCRGRQKTFHMDTCDDEGPDLEIQMLDWGHSEQNTKRCVKRRQIKDRSKATV